MEGVRGKMVGLVWLTVPKRYLAFRRVHKRVVCVHHSIGVTALWFLWFCWLVDKEALVLLVGWVGGWMVMIWSRRERGVMLYEEELYFYC